MKLKLPIVLLISFAVLISCSNQPVGLLDPASQVGRTQPLDFAYHASVGKNLLTLISLNLAHGRKDHASQFFLQQEDFKTNLLDIARYLKQYQADIVALQEADGPSKWSGNFDHVRYLADHSGYYYFVRSEYIQHFLASYGTGILTNIPIAQSFGYSFEKTAPTPRKGFTLVTVAWRPNEYADPVLVDVVSLHLDFLRKDVREQQIEQLAAVLEERPNPLIVMGDFNSDAIPINSLPTSFAGFRDMHFYKVSEPGPRSYKNRDLDWVLLSREFEFVDYQIDDVVLSDHRPVRVTLKYSQ
jgi:endonuclease/exonuclease/phosphatase family metal-dependent hydrolase